MVEQHDPREQADALPQPSEKAFREAVHIEETATHEANLVYDGEEEPELHFRTWIALGSMFLLNLVQVFALQGPPAVVSAYLALDKTCRLTRPAVIHWHKPQQLAGRDMGSQLTLFGPSSDLPLDIFGIRHIPSEETVARRDIHHLICGCGDCSWIQRHLQAHCGPNVDWIRIRGGSPRLLRSK